MELENGKAVWTGKNVKNDFLDMQVPGKDSSPFFAYMHMYIIARSIGWFSVWVTDLNFLPNDPKRIAVVSGHHQIRVYDVKCATSRNFILYFVNFIFHSFVFTRYSLLSCFFTIL